MFIETKKLETQTNNIRNEQVYNNKTTTNNKKLQTQTNNARYEHNKRNRPIFFVSKYLVCNFSTFTHNMCKSPKNSIKTNMHLQTSRSFNRVRQDILWVPKTIHAQQCCASKGKMKVKKATNKTMITMLCFKGKMKVKKATNKTMITMLCFKGKNESEESYK